MTYVDFWKLSLRNIFAAPVRSALTILGMAIGIGSILAVLTLGDAGKVQVRSEMARLGIDRVWLTAGEDSTLRYGDAEWLAQELGTTVTEQVYIPTSVRIGTHEYAALVVGCTSEYMRIMDTTILQGQFLYALDWQAGSRCVLVGSALAKEAGLSPGDRVSVGGVPVLIRGILQQRNELSQVDSSRAVFMPVAVCCELMGQTVHELTLTVPQDVMPQAVAAMAQDLMRLRRGTEVEAITMQAQIEAANSVIAIFVDVLKWVAAICILVGGIGVMNILLVSVRERRREIGVMKSLGASQEQVCALFLLEALLYALAGGAFGILIGLGLIRIAGQSIGLNTSVRLGDVAAVFAAALAVGLFFGVTPAMRAARLLPVYALRDD